MMIINQSPNFFFPFVGNDIILGKVYKEEMEEMEMDMEIGSPTDVKHVTHIGCDATTRDDANSFIAWETLLASSSWKQFDDQL